jgi:hypothetical protein
MVKVLLTGPGTKEVLWFQVTLMTKVPPAATEVLDVVHENAGLAVEHPLMADTAI